MRLIDGDHLEERVRKIIKDYAQAAKDINTTPGRVIFSSCGVIGLVESELTVDAVPVQHGKWMEIPEAEMFMCSECGEPGLSFDDVYIYDLKPANFCPNCGADMRKDSGDGSTD